MQKLIFQKGEYFSPFFQLLYCQLIQSLDVLIQSPIDATSAFSAEHGLSSSSMQHFHLSIVKSIGYHT